MIRIVCYLVLATIFLGKIYALTVNASPKDKLDYSKTAGVQDVFLNCQIGCSLNDAYKILGTKYKSKVSENCIGVLEPMFGGFIYDFANFHFSELGLYRVDFISEYDYPFVRDNSYFDIIANNLKEKYSVKIDLGNVVEYCGDNDMCVNLTVFSLNKGGHQMCLSYTDALLKEKNELDEY